MGYALLWAEHLATTLILIALATALAARWRRRRLALAALAAVTGLVALVGYGVPVIGTGMLRFAGGVTDSWFWYTVSATAVFILGWVLMQFYARRRDETGLWRAATWPVGLLAAALAVSVLLQSLTFWNLDNHVAARMASLRLEAGALALSVASPRIPDDQNAALVYEQAFKALEDLPKQERTSEGNLSTKADAALTADEREELLRLVATRQPALELLRRAAAMPDCNFDDLFANPSLPGLAELMEHSGRMRRSARLLWLSAKVRTLHGDTAGAVEDINAVFAMARHQAAQPYLISMLVSLAMDNMSIEAVEMLVNEGEPKAEDLEALRLPPAGAIRSLLRRALVTEEALGAALLYDMAYSPNWPGGSVSGGDSVSPPMGAPYRVFLLPTEIQAHKALLRHHRALAGRPLYEVRDDLERPPVEQGFLTRPLRPALVAAHTTVAQIEARSRCAAAALAVQRYRLERGAYPASLTELVPTYLLAVPQDPFNGQPLRLKAAEQELLIYSVSQDLRDDEGAAESRKKGDIRFRLRRR